MSHAVVNGSEEHSRRKSIMGSVELRAHVPCLLLAPPCRRHAFPPSPPSGLDFPPTSAFTSSSPPPPSSGLLSSSHFGIHPPLPPPHRLETVIPKEGSRVRIVNGAHRGATAQLLSLNVDEFCVAVKISDGAHAGRVIERVEYEDVCKLDAS
eukprot:scaffold1179_cov118-Isochrysis_galbana.AAC.6